MFKKNNQQPSVVVIGSGIGGLAVANLLAKKGHSVTLIEKNKNIGGKINVFSEKGFTFDMGPSWYLMPDVFEHYYGLLGEKITEHFDLVKLTPSYRAFFENEQSIDVTSDVAETTALFESLEPGAGEKFKKYISQSSFQYKTAYDHFLFKNYDSIFDFFNWSVVSNGLKMNLFLPVEKFVRTFFENHKIHKILEYTLVFLGSSPYNAPALYALMSHVDFVQGVFYPKGGLYTIVESLGRLARQNGVTVITGEEVKEILIEKNTAVGFRTEKGTYLSDIVISNADIWHTEQFLIQDKKLRMYSEKYWDTVTMAPSGFILYIGLNKKIEGLLHHNLYFRRDWSANFEDIFTTKKIPMNPCLYVCCPTKTDATIAPPDTDSLFVLVPFPDGVFMNEQEKKDYTEHILDMLEEKMQLTNIRSSIAYIRSYDATNFSDDYNVFRGSALGFAHTLLQSAYFRAKNKHSKIKNLYFVGGGTTPGIGMPMCLISAELLYKRIHSIKNDAPLESL